MNENALEDEADGLGGAVAEEDVVDVGAKAVAALEEVRELLPDDGQALRVAVRADAAWGWVVVVIVNGRCVSEERPRQPQQQAPSLIQIKIEVQGNLI